MIPVDMVVDNTGKSVTKLVVSPVSESIGGNSDMLIP